MSDIIYGMIGLLLIAFFFYASEYEKELIDPDQYKGSIVIDNDDSFLRSITILQPDSTIISLEVYKIDFQKYQIGDTIKPPKTHNRHAQ